MPGVHVSSCVRAKRRVVWVYCWCVCVCVFLHVRVCLCQLAVCSEVVECSGGLCSLRLGEIRLHTSTITHICIHLHVFSISGGPSPFLLILIVTIVCDKTKEIHIKMDIYSSVTAKPYFSLQVWTFYKWNVGCFTLCTHASLHWSKSNTSLL